jgi:Tfp pilus assembly protein PilE
MSKKCSACGEDNNDDEVKCLCGKELLSNIDHNIEQNPPEYHPGSTALATSYKRINPNLYIFSTIIGIISFILCGLAFGAEQKFLFGLFVFIGICAFSFSYIYNLIALSRCWGILQGTTARTTPIKAVGFLFIPFFNIYWGFIAYPGLATDANKFAERQDLTKRISFGFAVATCILYLIPYISILTILTNAFLIYQMAAVNNEILDNWDNLTEHPDPSKNNGSTAIIIGLCCLVFVAIVGILAAIAIPQFSAYRAKGYNAAALADCRDLKTNLAAYYADNQTYPSDIKMLGENHKFMPSKDIEFRYDPVCQSNNKCDSYFISTHHLQGDRSMSTTSENPRIMYKQKSEPDSSYKPI